MSEVVVEFRRVTRSFGDVRAIDDLSLSVPRGTICVLLGPNGAGKTTTVRLATGSLPPDSGSIRVMGLDPETDGQAVRRRTGVVPPNPALYRRLTGRENLEYAGRLYDLGSTPPIRQAAARFGIDYALDHQVSGYSTGMRTRLALARALLHDPELLLLDEPTAGLDPESAKAVLDLIVAITEKGRTIVMCTHLLHEAEGIADQVVLMSAGTAPVAGPPGELAARYWPDTRVRFDAEETASLDALAGLEGVLSAEWNTEYVVELDDPGRLPDIVARLAADGVRLTRVEPLTPTLEDLYFQMQRFQDEKADG